MNKTYYKQTEIGEIPEDWEVRSFGELGYLKNGVNFNRNQFGNGYKVINVTNLFSGRFATVDKLDEIIKGAVSNPKEYFVRQGDLLFARSSIKASGTGQVALVKENYEDTVFSGFIIRFRPNNGVNTLFLNYLLRSPNYRQYFISNSSTTTITNLNQPFLSSIPIIFPPIDEQNKIADFISILDDKIELNRKINKTLEEIGKALFKRWFVDFEFPNEEGKPYKSNGGEMVDSELGEIPKGWEVKNLGGVLLEIQSGRRPRGGVGQYKTGVPSIGAENIDGLANYDYSKEKLIPEDYFDKLKQGILKHKDILLYKDGAQIGRKTIFRNDFPHKTCCVNEHVFILRVTYNLQNYLYFWLDQSTRTTEIINLNSNAAQPGINQDAVKSLKILIPGNRALNSFDVFIEDLLNNIYENAKENLFLSQLRDSLLPRLMSGKLRVN